MILAVLSCLFIFLGMIIGNKFDFKKLSINVIFGLFAMNFLSITLSYVYSFLYSNYHSSVWLFILFSVILGYLIIKFINCKYDDCDNISIFGFTVVNTCLFISHTFSILFLIINILYYIMIGIYIKKSKSWIYVLCGCALGILLSFIKNWAIGYIYGIDAGFILYFVLSVYNMVFRNKEKGASISLIIGFIVALLGGLL